MSIYRRKIKVKGNKTLIGTTESLAYDFFMKHPKPIVGFGIIAIVLGLTLWGYSLYNDQRTERLSNSLYLDFKYQDSLKSDSDYARISKSVSEIDNETAYAGSIKLAGLYYAKGQYNSALKEYKRVVEKSKNSLLKIIGSIGIGYAHEGNSEYDKAIKIFNDLEETIGNKLAYEPYKMIANIAVARCYEEEGNIQEAVKKYQNIKEIYPDSKYIDQINLKLEILNKT